MKTKSMLRIVLLLIALGSLAVWGAKEFKKSREIAAAAAAPKPAESVPAQSGHQVVMTYFRNSIRCTSCKKIEALTTETTQKELAKDIASGKLLFRVIDVDEPANHHYIEEYKLTTKAVILSYRLDGKEQRWEDMEKIWDLLDQPDAFRAYLAAPVLQYLGS